MFNWIRKATRAVRRAVAPPPPPPPPPSKPARRHTITPAERAQKRSRAKAKQHREGRAKWEPKPKREREERFIAPPGAPKTYTEEHFGKPIPTVNPYLDYTPDQMSMMETLIDHSWAAGFELDPNDQMLQFIMDATYFEGLRGTEWLGARQALEDYLIDNYGMYWDEFEDFVDWEQYQEWYDQQ